MNKADHEAVNGEGRGESVREATNGLAKISNDHSVDRPSDPDQRQQRLPLLKEILFILIICSSNIITQAGLTMTVLPLNIIGNGLDVESPGQKSWFVAAFSLTVGTFILVAGRIGDIVGHKILLIIGYSWCAIWSMICGLTVYPKSQIFFDVARAMQGIGPAMLVPSSLAILGSTYPPGGRKNMVFAIYGATAPNGALLGAVFASLLSQLAWWPWAFYAMTFACIALAAVAALVIPKSTVSKSKSDQGFDWLGAVTGITGLVFFNIAWNQAPNAGWDSPYIIVSLILGVILTIMFFLIEKRATYPLIPREAISRSASFVLACVALGWSSFGIWVFYLVQFLENLRHLTPLNVVAQMVPVGFAGLCAALTTGILLSRIPTPFVMAIAMLAFCIGNILLATMPVGQNYWIQTFLSLIITPWGMDMSFPAATIILSNLVPDHQQGIAASLVATVVNYSISIGLGIAGTVELHAGDAGKHVLAGYRAAFYTAIGLSGLGFIIAILATLRLTASRHKSVA